MPFIGPQKAADFWMKWGVPADRIVVVKPGDKIKIKDLEIVAMIAMRCEILDNRLPNRRLAAR